MTDENERVLGHCVICRRRTDTKIGIQGPAEVPIALLIVLGVSQIEATRRVADYAVAEFGCDPGMVPDSEEAWHFLACRDCAEPMTEDGVLEEVFAMATPVDDRDRSPDSSNGKATTRPEAPWSPRR